MASPFRYFRKHTKAFMAIAAVMCMFLFVFASGTGGGRGREPGSDPGATVATWNGGSLNEGQLAGLVQQRLITDQFLRALFAEGGGRTAYDLPPSVPEFLLRSDRIDAVELEVVDTEVFASLATEAGITVDDAMINYYLQEFGLGRVGTDQIRGILANIGSRNVQSNTAIVFSQLRKLLLSYFYRRSYEDAGALVLPTQRWDDWRRVNERISLQAAVLPTDSFLADVPTPTEAQLKALYDEYAEAVPDVVYRVGGRELPSPNPGFAVPRRVKVRYLRGSVAERTAQLLDSVTEEEIADYYERNKRLEFVKSDEDEFSGDDTDEAADPAAESADAPSESTGEGAADEAGEGAADEGESAADDAEDRSAEDAVSEADGAEPAAEEAEPAASEDAEPAAEAADPATTDDAEPAAEAGEQSSMRGRSPFVLTAFQAEPAAGEAADDAADAIDESAEVSDEATEASDEAAEASDEAADDGQAQPADGAVQDDAAAADGAAVLVDGADAAADAEADESPAEGDAAAPVEEYVPLDEVRDVIRETLARDKAVQQLGKAIGEASAKLHAEYNRYGRSVIEARELKKPAPEVPERLANLDWLADAYGLEAETTEALTDRELFETPVGKAVDDQSGRLTVTQAVFTGLELFEPFLAQELEGDWYLVMKVEDTPKRVPPFDEVRDQVAAAWKRIEAAKLAEAKAKELAEAFRDSDAEFVPFFRDEQHLQVVEQTALFSWRSYPVGPGMGYSPELSNVPELSHVGPDFMEVAFTLKDGDVAATMNYDRSAAYVIKLHSRQYTPEELRRLFLAEAATWPGQIDMLRERELEFRQSVNRRLFTEVAGFKFDEEWERRRAERFAENQ